MIDLTKYLIRSGDLIVFGGNDRSGLLKLPGEVLAGGIEAYSDSVLSHASLVIDSTFPGLDGSSLYIVESTIRDDQQQAPALGGRDGVQVNRLEVRLEEYSEDGSAWWLPLSDRTLSWLDINAMWPVVAKKLGDTFDIFGLVKFLLRHVPIVQEIPQLDQPEEGKEYCAELVSMLLSAAGIPGLHHAQETSQSLAELRIYREQVQLIGKPQTIARFNTV